MGQETIHHADGGHGSHRTNLSLINSHKKAMTTEQVSKIFTHLLLSGKVRQAVRFATNRDKSGILNSSDVDTKTGKTVSDVLHSKHPESIVPQPEELEDYKTTPEFVTLDITADTVQQVSAKLSGGAGPGGIDSTTLQHWLLRFGKESEHLRESIANLTSWLANNSPPWPAYCAIISNRLVALDKCPGVGPIGIGEIWRRLMAKCVLSVAGHSAKTQCGADQLCCGLECGIEGAVHALNQKWDTDSSEDDWGVLLVDAKNAFNCGNRIRMLWTIRHLWPEGARFAFNCYHHYPTLVLRSKDGVGTAFLQSNEGVTQGDPFSMVLYGLRMLPLTKLLKEYKKSLLQIWYADDAEAAGKFDEIKSYFKKIM